MTITRSLSLTVAVGAAVALVAGSADAQGAKPLKKCPVDAVVAGTVCMDKYEASVWRVPAGSKVIKKIQQGQATQADLLAAGATQLGTAGDDYAPCAHNGQNCAGDIYAVSLPGVTPSRSITWFQAQEACANSGKRLPTSAEWQVAANGTPDGEPCNVLSGSVRLTGASVGCVSARGAFDMVGNLWEWVADWVPISTECPGWGDLSDDQMCLSGSGTTMTGPGALIRGGYFSNGSYAGPLAVDGGYLPSITLGFLGFRCAR